MKATHIKKVLIALTALNFCLSNIACAQDASVEKTSGVQISYLGVWAHKEFKLLNEIALRAEIGMNAGFRKGSFYNKTGFLMTPVITLEPRWYYNLDTRVSKAKNISGNSGNFLTIQASYHPNWFVISNYDNIEIASQISFIPTWGIKRNVGKHFAYETGIGVGLQYRFAKNAGYAKNETDTALNVHLRLGYRF